MADETIRLDMPQMIERFKFLGPALGPSVYSAMLLSAQRMLADVVSKRMSNPRRGSTSSNLGVDTGTARRSMTDQAGYDSEKVFALIGSPLGYVRVHEEGFSGVQHVRAHTAQHRGKIIARSSTGAVAKRRAVSKREKARGPWNVRAHDRKVNIIAKHFIRDTVVQAVPQVERRVVNALLIAAKTGRVPTPGQIGA